MEALLPMKRQALHAWKLDLSQAVEKLNFIAPPTEDFADFAEKEGLIIPY